MTRSLLFVFLFVFSAFFAAPAMAVAPVTEVAHNQTSSPTPGWFSTRDALCAAWTAWATGNSGNTYECVPPQDSWTQFKYRYLNKTTGAWTSTLTQSMKWRYWCASGMAPDTTKPFDQQCNEPPPPSCPTGQTGSGTWYHSTGSEESNIGNPNSPAVTGGCVNNCSVKMTDIEKCYLSTDGKNYCTYKYSTTGGICSAGSGAGSSGPTSPAPPMGQREDVPPFSPPPGSKCPAGTVQGGVAPDGAPVCIGTGSDPKNSPPPPPKIETEKTEATPDGGSKTTQTTTTQNSDGSTTTTTTTTTTAPDGSKTTTVDKNTTTNSTGGAGKDESTKDDEKYDMCKQNPMLTVCRNSSVAGTCGQITCQGDAIQCATLRATAAMQCQQQSDIDALKAMPSTSLGEAILGGTDPSKGAIDDLVKGNTVDLSKPTLDQGGFVGAGACFPNRTINVMGKSVEVSFARVCQDIQPLRAGIMAVAFFVAYLIVSRSVLQS